MRLFNRFIQVDVGLGEAEEREEGIFVPGFRAESDKLDDETGAWKRGFTIHFEIGGRRGEQDDAIVKIFNLPDQIAWQTSTGKPLVVVAGWAIWHDVIFRGNIRVVETKGEGLDKITIFRCETTEEPLLLARILETSITSGFVTELEYYTRNNKKDAESYTEWTERVLRGNNILIGYIHPDERGRGKFRLEDAEILKDFLDNRLEDLSDDPKYHYFFRGGLLYFMPVTFGVHERIRLSFQTGLIEVSADVEDGREQDKKITMLLIPRIQKESFIEVVSGLPPGAPNLFRVVDFKHVSNNDEHFTIAKVKPAGDVRVISTYPSQRSGVLYEESSGRRVGA